MISNLSDSSSLTQLYDSKGRDGFLIDIGWDSVYDPIVIDGLFKMKMMTCISFVVRVEIIERVSSPAHDAVELFEVEHSVAISVCLLKHLLQLIVGDLLADFPSDTLQVLEGDLVEVVLVEKLEDLQDFLLGVARALPYSPFTMREVITPENSLKFSPSFSSLPNSA